MKLQNKAFLTLFTLIGPMQAVIYNGNQMIPQNQVKIGAGQELNPTVEFFGVQTKVQRLTQEFIKNHPNQINNVLSYLANYENTYRGIQGASQENLSSEAQAFVNNIKQLIDSLGFNATIPGGRTKLTHQQTGLYQWVITHLSDNSSTGEGYLL